MHAEELSTELIPAVQVFHTMAMQVHAVFVATGNPCSCCSMSGGKKANVTLVRGAEVVSPSQRVQIREISLDEHRSGWREPDSVREFREGRYGQALFRNIRLLQCKGKPLQDDALKWLLDDGYSSVAALVKVHEEWVKLGEPSMATSSSTSEATEADGIVFNAMLLDVLKNGILCDVVEYPSDKAGLSKKVYV